MSDWRSRGTNKRNSNRKSWSSNSQKDDLKFDGIKGSKLKSGVITEEESTDFDLYREYVQWHYINNVLYHMGVKMLNISDRSNQEFTNTLQRWFIFINEHFNEVPKYSYYPILPRISTEHKAAQFLRDAFVDKRFAYIDHASDVVERILESIEINHSEVIPHNVHPPLKVRYDSGRDVIELGRFKSPEIPRLKLLISKGGLVATARMLLRYEAFGNGSYQWGDPKEVHKVLYDKFNVRYEGFASPVNSRFIEYPDTHFCSLFPETDAPFGSLGDFFHVDMAAHEGGWSVNPPFLNDLMLAVAERIIAVLDNGYQGYFFCTFPAWEDDPGWRLLAQSVHLFKRFNLPPQHFVVQDAYGHTFQPKMSMNMFVMGTVPIGGGRLSDLGNILILDPVHALPETCDW